MKIPPTGIALEEIERQALIEALKMSNWVQKDAAELLSISPRVMNYKIKTLGIDYSRAAAGRWWRRCVELDRADSCRASPLIELRCSLACLRLSDAPSGTRRSAARR